MTKKRTELETFDEMMAKFNKRVSEYVVNLSIAEDFPLLDEVLNKATLKRVRRELTEETPPLSNDELLSRFEWLHNKSAMVSHLVMLISSELKVLMHVIGELEGSFTILNMKESE
jgi:hypothetical protein